MGLEQSCVDGLPQGAPHAGERLDRSPGWSAAEHGQRIVAVATREAREASRARAPLRTSVSPSSSEHKGKATAERRYTKWRQVRSETMDGDSVAVRTARPDEE
jgi:hypothetical protein